MSDRKHPNLKRSNANTPGNKDDSEVRSYSNAYIADIETEIVAYGCFARHSNDVHPLGLWRHGRGGIRVRLKRELASLRRVHFPLRSAFQVLLRPDHPFFPGNTEVYLREVLDHVLRLLDDLDAERDMASGALEASLAINANRLNQTMKTLAVITVAVAVVGSVFGAYGMNFEALPLAASPWGFWVIGLGTIGLVTMALVVGWRLGWW